MPHRAGSPGEGSRHRSSGVVLSCWPEVTTPKNDRLTVSTAVRALVLGTIGACLSAMLTFSSTSAELTIPARLANVYITITRPLIGATSGLVGLIMLTSGVLNLPLVSEWVVPFLFGFSERFLLGALQSQPAKEAR